MWRLTTISNLGLVATFRSFPGDWYVHFFTTLLGWETLVQPILLRIDIWVHSSHSVLVIMWWSHFQGALIDISMKRFIIDKLWWSIRVFILPPARSQNVLGTFHVTIHLLICNLTLLGVKLVHLTGLYRSLINILLLRTLLLIPFLTSGMLSSFIHNILKIDK